MPIIGGIQLIAFLANVVLGVLVVSKNIRAQANRAFAVFAFGMAGWTLCLYLMLFSTVDELFFGRLTFAFGSIMVAGLIWFTAEFPKQSTHHRIVQWIAAVIGVSYAALSMSPYMILTAEVREKSYIYGTFHPVIYPIWFLLLVGTILYAIIRSWIGHHRSRGIVRRQYQALAVGTTIYLIGMLVTNLLIPILFNDFRFNALGPIFSIVMLIFVAQSMLSYRAFDVRWILKWGLVVPALVSFFVGVIAFSTLLLSNLITPTWSYLVSALVLTAIYKPLFRILDFLATKIIVRGQYIFDDAVLAFSHLVQQHLALGEFDAAFVELLQSCFQFKAYAILTFAPNKTEVLESRSEGFSRGLADDAMAFVEMASKHDLQIVEKDELDWRLQHDVDPEMASRDRQSLGLLNRWGVDAVVPLLVHDTPVGLLLVGPKASNEALTAEDERLLEIIRGTVAPAIANAARFLEMEKLYARLLELDQAKSDFINVVSHQFRTPLTAIRWNVELLLDQDKKIPAPIHKSLETVHERSLYLTATLDRVFDILAIESRQLTFSLNSVDAAALTKYVLEGYDRVFQRKELKLTTDLHAATAIADSARLSVILSALLDNAAAFTPEHGTVSVSLKEEGKNAVFAIKDTGVGIPPEDMVHVFEKFYRGKQASTVAPDGAGIGLFVVKEFVDRMKGSVDIVSKPGKGTTVTVRLPLAKTKK